MDFAMQSDFQSRAVPSTARRILLVALSGDLEVERGIKHWRIRTDSRTQEILGKHEGDTSRK